MVARGARARGAGGGRRDRRRRYGLYVWKSKLPHRLEFFIRTTKVERPHLLEGDASGELAGVGRWRLFEHDGMTAMRNGGRGLAALLGARVVAMD